MYLVQIIFYMYLIKYKWNLDDSFECTPELNNRLTKLQHVVCKF